MHSSYPSAQVLVMNFSSRMKVYAVGVPLLLLMTIVMLIITFAILTFRLLLTVGASADYEECAYPTLPSASLCTHPSSLSTHSSSRSSSPLFTLIFTSAGTPPPPPPSVACSTPCGSPS